MGGGTGDSIEEKVIDVHILNNVDGEILFDGLTKIKYEDYKKEIDSSWEKSPIKNYFK